jgi:hypothetical protein
MPKLHQGLFLPEVETKIKGKFTDANKTTMVRPNVVVN